MVAAIVVSMVGAVVVSMVMAVVSVAAVTRGSSKPWALAQSASWRRRDHLM